MRESLASELLRACDGHVAGLAGMRLRDLREQRLGRFHESPGRRRRGRALAEHTAARHDLRGADGGVDETRALAYAEGSLWLGYTP